MKGTPLDIDSLRQSLKPHIKLGKGVDNISIAVAEVMINGRTEYFISTSGKSLRSDAPNIININGIDYKVIKEDNGSLGTIKGQDNHNHAEMKLASHINSTYANTDAKVNIAVQNTSDTKAGACSYCRG